MLKIVWKINKRNGSNDLAFKKIPVCLKFETKNIIN